MAAAIESTNWRNFHCRCLVAGKHCGHARIDDEALIGAWLCGVAWISRAGKSCCSKRRLIKKERTVVRLHESYCRWMCRLRGTIQRQAAGEGARCGECAA